MGLIGKVIRNALSVIEKLEQVRIVILAHCIRCMIMTNENDSLDLEGWDPEVQRFIREVDNALRVLGRISPLTQNSGRVVKQLRKVYKGLDYALTAMKIGYCSRITRVKAFTDKGEIVEGEDK